MNLIIRLKNLWMVVAIIAIAFLLISAATSALTIPDVFVSSTTGKCVKVDNFDPDQSFTCENLPSKYNQIWVR